VNTLDYIGFDIDKKTIQICVKRNDGEVLEELALQANRTSVEDWALRANINETFLAAKIKEQFVF
jgi:hypothetical protein